MDKLIHQIQRYIPQNEQEQRDQKVILQWLERGEEVLFRACLSAHLTASAWIVNPQRTKVLMAYHKIYNSWAWLGGHADGEKDLLQVALKEAREESGLLQVRPLSPDLYSLEVLTVDGHEKRGEYVPSHLHLNLTYLLEAEEDQPLRIKPDENSGVKWFTPEEALGACTEPWMRDRIYQKLNTKLNGFS